MPYPFQLPTTSATSLSQSFTSSTHPSLPLSATSHRHGLRQALKSWKRTPPSQQPTQLPGLISTINAYLPYLFALDAGLSGKHVAGEEVDVVLVSEVVVEWKPALSSTSLNLPNVSSASNNNNNSSSGGRAGRARVHSLESELLFVLLTLALAHTLSARHSLRPLFDDSAPLPTAEDRSAYINRATRSLLDANAILTFLGSRAAHNASPLPAVPDITPSTLSALASLSMAEATLLAVTKDDPYTAALAETRSRTSTDWMFRGTSVSKVRANLFARLCLAAADHARQAAGQLASSSGSKGAKLDDGLRKYADDVRRTARARAARFFGIDAEVEGKVGVGIAWLNGARAELGFSSSSSLSGGTSDSSSFSRLRTAIRSAREDRRIASNSTWGSDGGRLEESRVLDMLLESWTKQNDTLGAQLIPEHGPLLANMPSGREFHTPGVWRALSLSEEEVVRLRGPMEGNEAMEQNGEDSDEDESSDGIGQAPGAFPGEGDGRYY